MNLFYHMFTLHLGKKCIFPLNGDIDVDSGYPLSVNIPVYVCVTFVPHNLALRLSHNCSMGPRLQVI